MSRPELLQKAKREIEKRRQRAEADADAQRARIYALAPALAQLDYQMAQAGAQAARYAAEGRGEDCAARLAAVKEIDGRKAQMLAQLGFAQKDLDPKYNCALCNDTGVNRGRLCVCVLEEEKKLRREQVNASGPLVLCRFDNFDLEKYPETMPDMHLSPRRCMQRILEACRDYAQDFGPYSESLLMYGDAGLGKTHLALSIAAGVLDKGYDVIYVSAQNAFSSVVENRFTGGGNLFASMLEADLLILDDLGTEYMDNYVLSKLYELVNTRMHRRPTIYTTNICDDTLMQRRYTEKIASRLLGGCDKMRFWGQDIRLQTG